MNRSISRTIAVILAAFTCITCLCACGSGSPTIFNPELTFDPDRITMICFVSFTDYDNSLYMNEDGIGKSWLPQLKQPEALELAHEVEAIPDPVSAEGEYSFIIRINYVENGVVKSVERTGYNTFPDNWNKVVELTNKVGGKYDQVTNSKELAVVDANYLRQHFSNLDESIIPEDMTLDDIIERAHITYLTLYEPNFNEKKNLQNVIYDYLFDYFNLGSHQIENLDDNPATSTKYELKDFAYSRLDEVNWHNKSEFSCTGTYKGVDYEIIRYDMVQTWLDEESKRYDRCGFKGPHCQYQTEYQWEVGGYYYTQRNVYIDGSGKYLILTNCEIPGDIAAVVQ